MTPSSPHPPRHSALPITHTPAGVLGPQGGQRGAAHCGWRDPSRFQAQAPSGVGDNGPRLWGGHSGPFTQGAVEQAPQQIPEEGGSLCPGVS